MFSVTSDLLVLLSEGSLGGVCWWPSSDTIILNEVNPEENGGESPESVRERGS